MQLERPGLIQGRSIILVVKLDKSLTRLDALIIITSPCGPFRRFACSEASVSPQ